jgi:enamine deaminase RidA (YjgF/YER057c/UK114 family)/GNAT superfamily N-acetyltransferase
MIERVVTARGLFAPPAYSHVSVVEAGTRLALPAGAVPLDADGELVGEGDPVAQAVQVIANLRRQLGSVGSGLEDVVRTEVYVVGDDPSVLARVWEVVTASGLAAGPHSSTLIGVACLGYAGQLVEITATAVVPEVVLRRAEQADAGPAAEVYLRSWNAALPTVRRAHTDEQVREWFRQVVVASLETYVAVADGETAGVMVLEGVELAQLYLAPGRRGQGLGDRFVALAKELRPEGLELWTFQVNERAARFYERHGFVAVDRTDGAGNEEREPDVRYAWRP